VRSTAGGLLAVNSGGRPIGSKGSWGRPSHLFMQKGCRRMPGAGERRHCEKCRLDPPLKGKWNLPGKKRGQQFLAHRSKEAPGGGRLKGRVLSLPQLSGSRFREKVIPPGKDREPDGGRKRARGLR